LSISVPMGRLEVPRSPAIPRRRWSATHALTRLELTAPTSDGSAFDASLAPGPTPSGVKLAGAAHQSPMGLTGSPSDPTLCPAYVPTAMCHEPTFQVLVRLPRVYTR